MMLRLQEGCRPFHPFRDPKPPCRRRNVSFPFSSQPSARRPSQRKRAPRTYRQADITSSKPNISSASPTGPTSAAREKMKSRRKPPPDWACRADPIGRSSRNSNSKASRRNIGAMKQAPISCRSRSTASRGWTISTRRLFPACHGNPNFSSSDAGRETRSVCRFRCSPNGDGSTEPAAPIPQVSAWRRVSPPTPN